MHGRKNMFDCKHAFGNDVPQFEMVAYSVCNTGITHTSPSTVVIQSYSCGPDQHFVLYVSSYIEEVTCTAYFEVHCPVILHN